MAMNQNTAAMRRRKPTTSHIMTVTHIAIDPWSMWESEVKLVFGEPVHAHAIDTGWMCITEFRQLDPARARFRVRHRRIRISMVDS
jgi:hypothetical protein